MNIFWNSPGQSNLEADKTTAPIEAASAVAGAAPSPSSSSTAIRGKGKGGNGRTEIRNVRIDDEMKAEELLIKSAREIAEAAEEAA